MLAYAGTTPDRAQETQRVVLDQLRSLAGTISDEELARAKANIKATLVIGDESSASRAGSNASDWWLDRRVRTLDEVQASIDRVEKREIDRLLQSYPPDSYVLLTLGSKALEN